MMLQSQAYVKDLKLSRKNHCLSLKPRVGGFDTEHEQAEK